MSGSRKPGRVGYGKKVHWLVERTARGPGFGGPAIERPTLVPLCEKRGARAAIGPGAYATPGCWELPEGTPVDCSRCLGADDKREAARASREKKREREAREVAKIEAEIRAAQARNPGSTSG